MQTSELFKFTIPFIPTKLRPRFNGRVSRVFNPQQNHQQSQHIASLARQAMVQSNASIQTAKKPVYVAITAYKKNRLARPDVDNIAKLVLDALNGVAYVDDRQVTVCQVTKLNNTEEFNNQVTVLVGRAEQ